MSVLRVLKEWKNAFRYGAIALAGVLLVVFLSDQLASQISRLLVGDENAGREVAQVLEVNGSVQIVSNGAIQKIENTPFVIRDGDRIETTSSSSATLILNSQDEIRISDGSNVMFQLWSKRDGQSPLYMTVLSGKMESLKSGVRGRAYMVIGGRLYFPGQTPNERRPVLVLNKVPVDLSLSENELNEGDTVEEEASEVDDETDSAAPTTVDSIEPESLSNEYIDETIARRQSQLQKCWISRVKNLSVAKGKVVVQIQISRRGKVKDPKVIDSEINDEALHQCILNVMERMSFRSFSGAEISLSYPIQFE